MFPPFRAEDYRQEVHAQVYRCHATNPHGTVHSRDVHVRAGKVFSRGLSRLLLTGSAGLLMCRESVCV